MVEQLPIFPRYRVKGEETTYRTLQEAARAVGRVTLDVGHRVVRRPGQDRDPVYAEQAQGLTSGQYARTTLFCEIEAVPESTTAMADVFDAPLKGDRRIEASYLAELGVRVLSRHVAEHWDPNQVHVMTHSSGYDSRILGGILRMLADQKGLDWLGETYFVCWQPEIAYWRRMMQYMGWPDRMLVPVQPGTPHLDYYREALRFDDLKAACDIHRIWAGVSLAVKELTERGVDVSRAMIVSAVFGDETGKANRIGNPATIGAFLCCYFYDLPSIWSVYTGDALLPFLGRPWLSLLGEYQIPCPVDEFKLEMLNIIDPNLTDVRAFPNYRFVAGPILQSKGYLPYQMLSDETVAELERAVRGSWYGRTVMAGEKLTLPHVLYPYSEAGHEILRAAICEGLVDSGVEINWDRSDQSDRSDH